MNTNVFYDVDVAKHYINDNTYIHQYQLQPPGVGSAPSYINDVNIRLTHWGANRSPSLTSVENNLTNRHRKFERYDRVTMDEKRSEIPYRAPSVASKDHWTTHSRLVEPAWELKDNPQWYHKDFPLRDSQSRFRSGPLRLPSLEARFHGRDRTAMNSR